MERVTGGVDPLSWTPHRISGVFATLERELIDRHQWATRADVAHAIFNYLAAWYNTRRLHSTLNYQSPAAYERQLTRDA